MCICWIMAGKGLWEKCFLITSIELRITPRRIVLLFYEVLLDVISRMKFFLGIILTVKTEKKFYQPY